MYLQINTVKYNTDREITNIYENLWIVWSQFCTDRLLFLYTRSTLNIYWFIGIKICCQRILMNSYSVTFGYSQYLVQHLMNDTKGKKTTICRYLFYCISKLPPSHPTKLLSPHQKHSLQFDERASWHNVAAPFFSLEIHKLIFDRL